MNIKNKGFTLIELLVATGIASIVITSALGTIGNIYMSQKKVMFAQNFYSEAQILMGRISQIVRNNTIDYDLMFAQYGPSGVACANFDALQTPGGVAVANNDITDSVNITNRAELGYSNIFYWDTNSDGSQDRHLGGVIPAGTDDPCAMAWDTAETIGTLYLINGDRTMRTSIYRTEATLDEGQVEIRRQLGADINNDGKADIWGPLDSNLDGDYTDVGVDKDIEVVWDSVGSQCELHYDLDGNSLIADPAEQFVILGDKTSEDLCDRAHDYTTISPPAMDIDNLYFFPTPARDPFLNFRVEGAQVHPQAFITLKAKVRNPQRYGFGAGAVNTPTIEFQTMVSSRVYGNTR